MTKGIKRSATQLLALLVTVMFVAAWSAWPALAQSTSTAEEEPADVEELADEDSSVALIMDASDSMMAEDVDGGTRLDAAKQAANQLVDSLPETAVMGMLVYGASESNAPDNSERGCEDIDVLAPVERINKKELSAEIDGIEAQGYTPMGNALRAAADELGSEGDRSIILVSDGIDTCAPPPVCDVAEELAGEGFDLTIHTVGFKADEAAQEELECVSEVSGGTYVEANNAEELGHQLEFLAQRDVVGYETAGTEFEYADTIEDAEWLGEGQYQTRVEATATDDVTRYFRVAVPEGHDAHVSVTAIPDRDESGETDAENDDGDVILRVNEVSNNLDGSDCQATKIAVPGSGGADLRNYSPTRPLTSFIDGSDPGNCDMDEWIIGHSFTGDGYNNLDGEELSVEVNVFFEPVPPENVVLPEGHNGSASQNVDEVSFEDAQETENGTSFNDAVEIEPGTYNNKIVAGEVHYYKVPVEWGQIPQLAIRSRLNENIDHAWMTAQLVNPVRTVVEDPHLTSSSSNDTEVARATADRPVRYNNRNANWGGGSSTVAGDYFIAVSMSIPQQEGSLSGIEQDYELAVDVTGEVDEHPNDWRPSYEPGPEPTDEPPTYDAASEEATAEVETSEEAAADAETENTAAEGSSEGGFSALIWGVVGLLVLALIGIFVAMGLKLRKK